MVIEPRENDYKNLVSLMLEKMQKQEQLGDQDIINEYFQNINTLPQSYNLMRRINPHAEKIKTQIDEEVIYSYPLYCCYNTEEKKILHYIIYPKPFQIKAPYQEIYSYLYLYYVSLINEKKNDFIKEQNSTKKER